MATEVVDKPIETVDAEPAPVEQKAPVKKRAKRRSKPTQKAPAKKGPGRPPTFKAGNEIAKLVTHAGAGLGVAAGLVDNPTLGYDGQVLVTRADAIGEVVQTLCDQNPRMNEAVKKLVQASTSAVYIQMALVAAQIAVPIAMAHGLIRPDALGQLGTMVLPLNEEGTEPLPIPAPRLKAKPIQTVPNTAPSVLNDDDVPKAPTMPLAHSQDHTATREIEPPPFTVASVTETKGKPPWDATLQRFDENNPPTS